MSRTSEPKTFSLCWKLVLIVNSFFPGKYVWVWTGTCSEVLHWSPCLYSAHSASFSHLIIQPSPWRSPSVRAQNCVRSHQMSTSTLFSFLSSQGALVPWTNGKKWISTSCFWPCCNCSFGAWVPNVGREYSESACYFNKDEACFKSKPCGTLLKINQGRIRNILLTCWWIIHHQDSVRALVSMTQITGEGRAVKVKYSYPKHINITTSCYTSSLEIQELQILSTI